MVGVAKTCIMSAPKTDDDDACKVHTNDFIYKLQTTTINKRKLQHNTMVVMNKKKNSMSGRKHLLDDHRYMVDYRQVPVSVQ